MYIHPPSLLHILFSAVKRFLFDTCVLVLVRHL
jgi:hypothetical protein